MFHLHIASKKIDSGRILDGIDLSLPSKGLILLTGENGAGKSTLLNILSGADQDYDGSIAVGGKALSKKDYALFAEGNAVYLTQDPIVFEDESALENVLLAYGRKYKAKALGILKELNLEGVEDQKASSLSQGEKQRITLARALIKDPKILLVDEITANLDRENAEAVLALLRKLSKDRLVLFATHESFLLGDKDVRMRIIMQGGKAKAESFFEDSEDVSFGKGKRKSVAFLSSLRWVFKKDWALYCTYAVLFFALGFLRILLPDVLNGYADYSRALYESALENGPSVLFKMPQGSKPDGVEGEDLFAVLDSSATLLSKVDPAPFDWAVPEKCIVGTLGLIGDGTTEETFLSYGIQKTAGVYPKDESEILISEVSFEGLLNVEGWKDSDMRTILEDGHGISTNWSNKRIVGLYEPFSPMTREDYALGLMEIRGTDNVSLLCYSLGMNNALTCVSSDGRETTYLSKVTPENKEWLSKQESAFPKDSQSVYGIGGESVGSSPFADFVGKRDYFSTLNDDFAPIFSYTALVLSFFLPLSLSFILSIRERKGYCMSRVIGIARKTHVQGLLLSGILSLFVPLLLGFGLGTLASFLFHVSIQDQFVGVLPAFQNRSPVLPILDVCFAILGILVLLFLALYNLSPKDLSKRLTELKAR